MLYTSAERNVTFVLWTYVVGPILTSLSIKNSKKNNYYTPTDEPWDLPNKQLSDFLCGRVWLCESDRLGLLFERDDDADLLSWKRKKK